MRLRPPRNQQFEDRADRLAGQASPPGFWYDQPWAEWVVVLAGSAGLRFEGEAEVMVLSTGHYILIPARVKHRVECTAKDHATIWLAVHYPATG